MKKFIIIVVGCIVITLITYCLDRHDSKVIRLIQEVKDSSAKDSTPYVDESLHDTAGEIKPADSTLGKFSHVQADSTGMIRGQGNNN